MVDYYRIKREEKQGGNKVPVWVIIILLVLSFAGGVVFDHYLVAKYQYCDWSSALSRIKGTFLSTVLGYTPEFYYLDVEKNGKDYRLAKGDVFEISYRDEFVLKRVSSDSLFERGISADIEGMGSENDFRTLLNGMELIDKVIRRKQTKKNKGYNIHVKYHDEIIASIPVKVIITPQDWLRYARSTKSKKSQIKFLQRALSMKKDDVNTRKALAGIYINSGKITRGIAEYKKVLKQKPGDMTALVNYQRHI